MENYEFTIDELLEKENACVPAKDWAKGKTWQEVFNTCHRGDWLLWLFQKTMPNSEEDLKRLTLAKSHCAATVLHLMTDERSKDAVQAAIDFGEGTIDRAALNAAAYAAAYAAYAADASYAASYAAAAAATAADAREQNQLATANICRKYLPIEIWNVK